MTDTGEEREMWSWEGGEEPEPAMWRPTPLSEREWAAVGRRAWYAREGARVFSTREDAIRHAIADAERDREVLAKAAAEIEGKLERLLGMLEATE